MANEIVNEGNHFIPKGAWKAEGKNLPTWEFFYTGTLWRITRGLRGWDNKPLPEFSIIAGASLDRFSPGAIRCDSNPLI